MSSFDALSIRDLLEADSRPTIVLDRTRPLQEHTRSQPLLCNTAWRRLTERHNRLLGLHADGRPHLSHCKAWLDRARVSPNIVIAGVAWHCIELAETWLVVSAIDADLVITPRQELPQADADLHDNSEDALKERDWTRTDHRTGLSAHINLILDTDWNSTPVGARTEWPDQLRFMLHLMNLTPEPAVVFWGDEHTMFYNEAYIVVAGQKHPRLMGQSPAIGFAEVCRIHTVGLRPS